MFFSKLKAENISNSTEQIKSLQTLTLEHRVLQNAHVYSSLKSYPYCSTGFTAFLDFFFKMRLDAMSRKPRFKFP